MNDDDLVEVVIDTDRWGSDTAVTILVPRHCAELDVVTE